MTQPLVSIIIPTYNRAHLIGETLDSVLAQTYTHWECIVVDDGSTDATNDIMQQYLKKDSRIQYHHRPKKHLPGGNGARNYGFELSKGDYIQWFDDDDLMDSNCVKYKLTHFNINTEFVISGGFYLYPDCTEETINLSMSKNLYKDYVLWKINIFTPSILFRKSFLNDKPLFNEMILKGQESEFFGRLFFQVKENQYYILNIPLFYYRRHLETKSEAEKVYVSKYKYSFAINNLNNFEKALQQKDEELIVYFYKKCIKLYYSALRNYDNLTAAFVFKRLQTILKHKERMICFKMQLLKIINNLNKSLSKKIFLNLKNTLPKT